MSSNNIIVKTNKKDSIISLKKINSSRNLNKNCIQNNNESKSMNINNNINSKIKCKNLPKISAENNNIKNHTNNNNVNLKGSLSSKKIFYCKKKEKELALLRQKIQLEKNLLNRIYFNEIEKILLKKKKKDLDESNNMDLFNRDLNYNSNMNDLNNNNNNKLKKIVSYDNIKCQKLPIITNEDKNNFINGFKKVTIFENKKNYFKNHKPIEHKYLHLRNLTKFNNTVFKKQQINHQKNILSTPNIYK
jgi:hypothetical protein